MLKKLLVIVVFCFFVSGCDMFMPQKVEKKTYEELPIIKGVLLAQVNDWAIGTQDFRDQLDALKTLYPEADVTDPEIQKRILQELVNFEILAQEAELRGLDKEKDVQDAVKNFKRTFLAQKILENIAKETIVTDVEIRNFYDSNKLSLREPEERKIREIVVLTESEAKNILIRLIQGESFSRLALDYSIADSKNKGGDLGYLAVNPEEKFQKFWEEAFTKEKGGVSNYFRSPDGKYYIIKVEDIRGGEVKPLSEVRENIEEHLRRIKIERKKEDVIFNAKQKFKVIVNENLLD